MTEVDQNSRDFSDEPLNFGSASPVIVHKGKDWVESNFELGWSLEGDLIKLIKDYRCVLVVSCRAFKENPKNNRLGRRLP